MQNFNELSLSSPLLQAIQELGFEKPSPIQAETLPILLGEPTDFLGLAATGTGKTAAFAIPLLERIDPKVKRVQALILCPTRELAIQVAGQIDLLGKYKSIKTVCIYGGTGYGDQIAGIRAGASIVIGTPGRVVDHLDRGTLKLEDLNTLILDEADEMISMGFKEDLETVLSSAPTGQANIWLFSATMGSDVRHVADRYLSSPQKVQINRTEMLPNTVEQLFFMTHEPYKPELICKLIDAAEDFYGIIFCQTKSLVVDLNQFLVSKGYKADCLHGDMDQKSRDRVMQAFRDRKISVLVATDVACRGLDVKDITHVINYSLPRELDNYVHRIGRTGRSGKMGVAMSLVTPSHRILLSKIERMTKVRIKEGIIPTRREIAQKKVEAIRNRFVAQELPTDAMAALRNDWKETLASMEKEEIALRFLGLLYPDINASAEAKEKKGHQLVSDEPEQTRKPRQSGRGGERHRKERFARKPSAGHRTPAPESSKKKSERGGNTPSYQRPDRADKLEKRTPPWERKPALGGNQRPKKKPYGKVFSKKNPRWEKKSLH